MERILKIIGIIAVLYILFVYIVPIVFAVAGFIFKSLAYVLVFSIILFGTVLAAAYAVRFFNK